MRRFQNSLLGFLAFCVTCFPFGVTAQGALKPIAATPEILNKPRVLQLAVVINGEDSRYFGSFNFDPATGKLSATRKELTEASIKTSSGSPSEVIELDSLGYSYHYDDAGQKIEFTLADNQRLPRIYNGREAAEHPTARSDIGALVNYSIFGASVRDMATGKLQFNGANAQLDARVFSDLGLLQQTGIVGTTLANTGGTNHFLRLDSTYSFSNPESAVTYRAGDTISGGSAWTRPIHMAGAQISRDFTMRSDIVTQPLPVISGTAAAPSTVDILINGARTFSQQVGTGPYSITNLPINTTGGNAQVVIRDATGRTIETTLSLFNPAKMLAEGLVDFSLEGGLARRNYGVLSNDYLAKPIGTGTFRYGLAPWLTVESHAEVGAGLVNLGIGAIAGLGSFGTANVAISGSHSQGGTGAQIYADWQVQWQKLSFSVGSQRSFMNYDDLASVTANYAYNPILTQQTQFGVLPTIASTNTFVSPRPAKAVDRMAVSFPVFDDKSSLALSAVNVVQQNNVTSRLVTASVTRTLPWREATVFATTYADFGTTRSLGAFVGVSIPIWDGISSSVGATYDKSGGMSFGAEISKAQPLIDDTYGWRLKSGVGGASGATGEADASYRSAFGLASATVAQNRGSTAATAQFDGSLAVLGGGVFAGNKVNSSFAVVDAGVPGVTVLQDNRVVGKTGASGKTIVTNLRDWENNNIGINPDGMSVNFDASRTNEMVAPRGKSGVYVSFGAKATSSSAIVIFTGPDGKPVQVGAPGHLEGQSETFLVGHDGRAYVRDIAATNVAIIDLGERECRATFKFAPTEGRQTVIRGVVCQ